MGPPRYEPEREVPFHVPVHRLGRRLRDRPPAGAARRCEHAVWRPRAHRSLQRLLHHDGVALGRDRGIAPTVSRPETALYVVLAFLAAALAFLVEPLVARSLLPTYGGTSAVWTTALVFFQATLLAGYAWAHVTFSRFGLRRHAVMQVSLVMGRVRPAHGRPVERARFARPPASARHRSGWFSSSRPSSGFRLALSSASPTTQRWFAALPGGIEPYRLFAASNAGSLIGLVVYPTLVEPNIDLSDQARWWWVGFGVFVLLTTGAAWIVQAKGRDVVGEARSLADAPTTTRRLMGSRSRRSRRHSSSASRPTSRRTSLLSRCCGSVRSSPYLATLILAYARADAVGVQVAAIALIPLALAVAPAQARGAHAVPRRIHRIAPRDAGGRRADLARSTRGGASGARPPDGVHAVRGDRRRDRWRGRGHRRAPRLRRPIEGLLVLAAAVVLATPQGWSRVLAVPAVVGLGIAVAGTMDRSAGHHPRRSQLLRRLPGRRSVPDLHILYSGTMHGGRHSPGHTPVSRSATTTGPGRWARSSPRSRRLIRPRIGAVGLGAGAIAAYGRAGDSFRFFEIDPTVASIARTAPASRSSPIRRRRSMSMSKTGGSVSRRRRPKASTCSCSTPSPRTRFPSTC